MQVTNVGDASGLDATPNRVVPLLVGAAAVANAAGFVYAADGDDGHPDGHTARRRAAGVAGVLIHAGHDADGEVARLGPNAATDRLGARADPTYAARPPPQAEAPATTWRRAGQLVVWRGSTIRCGTAGLDPAPVALAGLGLSLD